MRPALPGELYEIFAFPVILYENLALIAGHCMEYPLKKAQKTRGNAIKSSCNPLHQ